MRVETLNAAVCVKEDFGVLLQVYGSCLPSPGHGRIPGLKSTHVKQEKLCENEAR